MLRYWRRLIRKATGADPSGAGVGDTWFDRLVAGHKSFVQVKLGQLDNEEAWRASLAEVDNESGGGGILPPGTKHFVSQTV